MLTRFYIEFMPKDGGKHRCITTDADMIIIPQSKVDSIIVFDGFETEVLSVSVAPTQDPMIYIRGRSIFTETTQEADELIKSARLKEGWREI